MDPLKAPELLPLGGVSSGLDSRWTGSVLFMARGFQHCCVLPDHLLTLWGWAGSTGWPRAAQEGPCPPDSQLGAAGQVLVVWLSRTLVRQTGEMNPCLRPYGDKHSSCSLEPRPGGGAADGHLGGTRTFLGGVASGGHGCVFRGKACGGGGGRSKGLAVCAGGFCCRWRAKELFTQPSFARTEKNRSSQARPGAGLPEAASFSAANHLFKRTVRFWRKPCSAGPAVLQQTARATS